MNRNTQNQTASISKSFSASLEQLHEMLHFIRENSAGKGLDRACLGKVELASEEALVNIISYSYPQKSGLIEIHCSHPKRGSGVEIALKDWGIAYNPLAVAKKYNAKHPLQQPTVGGYGIYFILQMMDEVHYKREADQNVLTLVKYS